MKREAVERKRMLVNGEWVEAVGGAFFAVENPSKRGSVLAEVPRGFAEDVDLAVKHADAAFPSWKQVTSVERGKILWKIADRIEERSEEIAKMISRETGNAIRTQSRNEVKSAVDIFRYFAGVTSEIKGYTNPIDDNLMSYTQREPLGVVAAIVPWNAPFQLSSLKIAPAIATGNTMVLKAAESAPLAVLMLGEICDHFLPDGVLNVLTGFGEECGEPLAKHSLVKKLTFTGSTAVGKKIMHHAADRLIPVSLELGGKSPQIVFPDADREKVIEGVVSAMRFSRQGQSCSAGTRLYLHRSIYDSFIEKLIARLRELKIGDPMDEATDMGSIINKTQFDKVCGFIEAGMNSEGVELLLGGLPPKDGPLSEGYYLQPTLFSSKSDDSSLAKKEIFGPLLLVIPWEDEEEVIAAANDSLYGLAAYVWTNDMKTALRTANEIESGWVQINRGLAQMPGLAYGGYKESGIGREFSLDGMLESYTQLKSIMIELKD